MSSKTTSAGRVAGQLLEQLADRPEKLLDGGLGHLVTQEAGEACGDELALMPGPEQRAELADALRRGVGRDDTGGVPSTSTTGQKVMPSP